MIALAYTYRMFPSIGTVSVLHNMFTPHLFILPPKSVSFQCDISKLNHTNIKNNRW